MKRSFTLGLALFMALVLCACGNSQKAPEPTDPASPYENVYDADGNLLVEYIVDVDDYIGKREYTYENGQRATEKEYDSQDSLIYSATYGYDASGVLYMYYLDLYEEDMLCGQEVWEYNTEGILMKKSYFDGTGVLTDADEYTYDEAGNLIKTVTYSYLDDQLFGSVVYDAQDLVIKENIYDENGDVAWSIDYEYENGLRIKGTESSGSYILYHYNEEGIEIGCSYYDPDGTKTDEIFYE